jgi:transposase
MKYDVYVERIKRLTNKAKILGEELAFLIGRDIASMCEDHHVDFVVTEELNWNTKDRSSRWNRAAVESAVVHSVHRVGAKHNTVSAVNNSHTCPECGARTVDGDNRTQKCSKCGHVEDRDSLASRNIATRKQKEVLCDRMEELLKKRKSKQESPVDVDGPGDIAYRSELTVGDSQVFAANAAKASTRNTVAVNNTTNNTKYHTTLKV